MKLITRDTDYAIRVLKFLYKSEGNFSNSKIIRDNLRIPNYFLRKIIGQLSKAKLINSKKGKNGGIELAEKDNEIKLYDIYKVFQGKFKLNECIFKQKPCPEQKKCKLKSKLDEIEKYVLFQLKKIKLKSIF